MPLWQLTVGEFRQLLRESIPAPVVKAPREEAHGIAAMAGALKMSQAKFYQLKRTGVFKAAIIQDGRKLWAYTEDLKQCLIEESKRRFNYL